MCAYDGAPWGSGKKDGNGAGGYKQGDQVGVLLGLSGGSLRFFWNDAQHGPGCAGVSATGPVVAAVQVAYHNESMWLLPNTQQPE
jgi:hypothetical protein